MTDGIPGPGIPETENGMRNRQARMIADAKAAARAAYNAQYGPGAVRARDAAAAERQGREALDSIRKSVILQHPSLDSAGVDQLATRLLNVDVRRQVDAQLATLQKSVDDADRQKRQAAEAMLARVEASAEEDAAKRVEAARVYSAELERGQAGRIRGDYERLRRINEIRYQEDLDGE